MGGFQAPALSVPYPNPSFIWEAWQPGSFFFGMGSDEVSSEIRLQEGKSYRLVVELQSTTPPPGGGLSLTAVSIGVDLKPLPEVESLGETPPMKPISNQLASNFKPICRSSSFKMLLRPVKMWTP